MINNTPYSYSVFYDISPKEYYFISFLSSKFKEKSISLENHNTTSGTSINLQMYWTRIKG